MDKYLSGFLTGPKKHESNSLHVPVEHIKDYYGQVADAFGALHQVAYKSDPTAMNQINELVSRQLAAQAAQEAGRLLAPQPTAPELEPPVTSNTSVTVDIEELRRKIAEMKDYTDETAA